MRFAQICIGLLLGFGQICHAANDGLIAKIQEAYSGMDSFEADFDQTLKHKESGSTEKRKGKIVFQKPLLVRWQTYKPHEETLVVNREEIWDYIPEEDIAYRYSPSVAQDSRSIIQVITGQAKLDKDFDVKRGGTENGLAKMILYPREPGPQMVEAAIWVDPVSGTIQRANVTDFYGNKNDIKFSSFKPGSRQPASQFKFKPPKGVEIEDRIGKNVPEKELFK